jgi:hypothetical protein
MSQSNLTRVLAGKSGLGPKAVVCIAETLRRDLRDILCLVEEDKARSAKEREFWERRSPRISAAIIIAFLVVVAGQIPLSAPSQTVTTTVQGASGHSTFLYIMRTVTLLWLLTLKILRAKHRPQAILRTWTQPT